LHKEKIALRATSTTIEIINKDSFRMASHDRRYAAAKGRYVTNEEHMPPNHKVVHQLRQFDGNRYRNWARKIGESTLFIIESLLTYERESRGTRIQIMHGYTPVYKNIW